MLRHLLLSDTFRPSVVCLHVLTTNVRITARLPHRNYDNLVSALDLLLLPFTQCLWFLRYITNLGAGFGAL